MKATTFVSVVAYAAATLSAANAKAGDAAVYDPPRTLKASRLAQGSLTIDVLGILPGMTPAEVGPLVRKAFGDTWYSERKGALGASRNSIQVRSSEYVQSVSGQKFGENNQNQDRIEVSMSGVAGGNQAIGLRRQMCYGDQTEPPFLVDVIKSLMDKYGPPSMTAPSRIEWAYKDGAKVDLPKTAKLSVDFDQYDASMLRVYSENDEPTDYRIEAQFKLNEHDRTRLRCLDVSTGSIKLRRDAAEADLEVLSKQLDQAVASHPHVAGPAL